MVRHDTVSLESHNIVCYSILRCIDFKEALGGFKLLDKGISGKKSRYVLEKLNGISEASVLREMVDAALHDTAVPRELGQPPVALSNLGEKWRNDPRGLVSPAIMGSGVFLVFLVLHDLPIFSVGGFAAHISRSPVTGPTLYVEDLIALNQCNHR